MTGDTLIVQCDNAEFESRVLSGHALKRIEIIGKVVWSGGRIADP